MLNIPITPYNTFMEIKIIARDCPKDKQKWVEEHTRQLANKFRLWQKHISIDNEYSEHLRAEMNNCYEDTLRKELIESICNGC